MACDGWSNAEEGRRQRRFLAVAVACVCFAGLSAAAIGFACNQGASCFMGEAAEPAGASLCLLVGVSALTALVEEVVFRGLLLRWLARIRSMQVAILATSILFALLHAIPFGVDAVAADPVIIVLSLCLKALQAFAFGIVMAGIVTRGGGLAGAVAAHALFDVLYFMPDVLLTGSFPTTYAVSQPEGLAVLAIGTALLVPAALLVSRTPATAG